MVLGEVGAAPLAAADQGPEAASLEALLFGRRRKAAAFEDRRVEVDMGHRVAEPGAGRDLRTGQYQGNPQRLLEEMKETEDVVVAATEAVIRGVDHTGGLRQAELLQRTEDTPDEIVQVAHRGEVGRPDGLNLRQRNVGLVADDVPQVTDRGVVRALVLVEPDGGRQIGGVVELVELLGRHKGRVGGDEMDRQGPGRDARDGFLPQPSLSRRDDAFVVAAVGRQVSGAELRRPDVPKAPIAGLRILEAQRAHQVADAVGDLHGFHEAAEAVVVRIVAEVHLADADGLVAGATKPLHPAVADSVVGDRGIPVAAFVREAARGDGRAGGNAERARTIGGLEEQAPLCQGVEVRRLDPGIAQGPEQIRRMAFTEQEQEVWRLFRHPGRNGISSRVVLNCGQPPQERAFTAEKNLVRR